MSYQPMEFETEEHASPSNGWELETAEGASFTWECDRMENSVEEQEGDLYFTQTPSNYLWHRINKGSWQPISRTNFGKGQGTVDKRY